MERKRLVVIGNGMAGVKCVEEIYKLDSQRFHITIFGNEPRPNYNRILLSKVLQGDSAIEDIIINDWSWYEEKGIRLFTGETVVRIQTGSKYVETLSGLRAEYDSLIIATGSSAFIPSIIGVQKSGVISFRNIDDCNTMMDYAKKYRKAAVIGGGLLGLEAARGLLNLGMETDVIHNAPYLMNRQLDRMSAELLRKELEQQGMRFWLNKETESITGRSRAKGIRFSTGATLEADLVVISVGIRPNIELARSSGIETNRAIVVDDYMRTSIPGVYAVGECAEHRGIAYGLVAPLYEQGKVLARVICNQESNPYTGSVPYAQLKVSGVEVFSAGDIREDEADTALQTYDGIRGTYKKVTMRGGIVRGAILFGDTSEGTSLLGLVKREAPVSALSNASDNSGGSDQDDIVAAMPDRETVCACNAVCKSAIMCAVIEDGLQTTEQVRDRTKASSSCGGCRPMVAAVVKFALRHGKEGMASSAPAVCGCTDLSHELLKAAIAESEFANSQEAMLALGWRVASGCPACRPAIHYYIALLQPIADTSRTLASRSESYVGLSVGIVTDDQQEESAGYDSRLLGTSLYNAGETLPFPMPMRAVITSGIHNPAGVLVHDIGITGAPAGWEIYAAGHAENPVKQGQLIGIAESDSLALEYAVACMQLYRERADFGEPMWKWMEREGIIEIREILFDTDYRLELADRAGAPRLSLKSEERLGEGICSK
ncbi:nitrite reductase large subunit NirB [Paenibacillus alkaliterrae]|uniref:nitrite reductase large subunit NirB n=1 Tax=Paenibacillus alkaliterrae TaxID=320909 RepID=UPI001F170246|nr:nitrite reductase large subunit NirB [Paenibacillus alkaliterrae]MCF2941645.1 nitrite reductase large subunit NirB [Paenibacillus alkaliterrae]